MCEAVCVYMLLIGQKHMLLSVTAGDLVLYKRLCIMMWRIKEGYRGVLDCLPDYAIPFFDYPFKHHCVMLTLAEALQCAGVFLDHAEVLYQCLFIRKLL